MKVVAIRNFSKFRKGIEYDLPNDMALDYIRCNMMAAPEIVFQNAGMDTTSASSPAAPASPKQTAIKSKRGVKKAKSAE